jgi:hypothetical protein
LLTICAILIRRGFFIMVKQKQSHLIPLFDQIKQKSDNLAKKSHYHL